MAVIIAPFNTCYPVRKMPRAILLPILLVAPLLAQTPAPDGTTSHHFEYPHEHFSLDVPASWRELEPAAATALTTVITKLLPAVGDIKIIHAYTASGTLMPPYPSVIVMQYPTRPSLTAMRSSFPDNATINGAVAKLAEQTGGLFAGQLASSSYDREGHVMRAIMHASSPLTDDLVEYTSAHLTKTGILQVECITKASEADRYEAVCNRVLDSFTLDAQASIPPPTPLSQYLTMSTQEADATYRDLVARARTGDLLVDFRAMRFACIKSSLCEVRATPDQLVAMNLAIAEHQFADAAKLGEAMIDRGFINLEVRANLTQVYKELSQPDRAKSEFDLITALLRSLYDYSDGKTEQTAFEVISVREIYVMMAGAGLPSQGDAVRTPQNYTSGGHRYQRRDAVDPKTQKEVSVFFLVDALDVTK